MLWSTVWLEGGRCADMWRLEDDGRGRCGGEGTKQKESEETNGTEKTNEIQNIVEFEIRRENGAWSHTPRQLHIQPTPGPFQFQPPSQRAVVR